MKTILALLFAVALTASAQTNIIECRTRIPEVAAHSTVTVPAHVHPYVMSGFDKSAAVTLIGSPKNSGANYGLSFSCSVINQTWFITSTNAAPWASKPFFGTFKFQTVK